MLVNSISWPSCPSFSIINYALLECGASILDSNYEVKNAFNVLNNKKDSYLLNQCSANKYFVIHLCDQIQINHISLANFELYSSQFKSFVISSVTSYPPKTAWTRLGLFHAQNTRTIQTFEMPNKKIWSRVIKIQILSDFGNDFYCPISTISVHGISLLEDAASNTLEDAKNLQIDSSLFKSLQNHNKQQSQKQTQNLKDLLLIFDSHTNPKFQSTTKVTDSEQDSVFRAILTRLKNLEQTQSKIKTLIKDQSNVIESVFIQIQDDLDACIDGVSTLYDDLLKLTNAWNQIVSSVSKELDVIHQEQKISRLLILAIGGGLIALCFGLVIRG